MTIVETQRLLLREYTAQDTDALVRVLSDPETMCYYPAPYDRAGVEQWIARNRQRYQDDGVGLWAMELKESRGSEPHKAVGDCGIVCSRSKASGFTKSDTTYVATFGDRVSLLRRLLPAVIGLLRTSKPRA